MMKACKAETGLRVDPISWAAAIVELVEADGIKGFAINRDAFMRLDNTVTERDLPIEFFNHQLMDCDPDDESSLVDFMTRWGLLFSPLRNSAKRNIGLLENTQGGSPIDSTTALEEALVMDWEDAERELARLKEAGEVNEDNEEAVADRLASYIGEPAAGRVISFEEASSTLRMMQAVVEIIRRNAQHGWENSEELFFVAEILNSGTCNSLAVQLTPHHFDGLVLGDGGNAYRFCLTSAICNQIIACLADKAPWRVCECEGCGRVFKRKQTNAVSPNYDAKCCCNPCMERQKKRNQRESGENRIQH